MKNKFIKKTVLALSLVLTGNILSANDYNKISGLFGLSGSQDHIESTIGINEGQLKLNDISISAFDKQLKSEISKLNAKVISLDQLATWQKFTGNKKLAGTKDDIRQTANTLNELKNIKDQLETFKETEKEYKKLTEVYKKGETTIEELNNSVIKYNSLAAAYEGMYREYIGAALPKPRIR